MSTLQIEKLKHYLKETDYLRLDKVSNWNPIQYFTPSNIISMLNPVSKGNLASSAATGSALDTGRLALGQDVAGDVLRQANPNTLPNGQNWGALGNIYEGMSHPVGAIGADITGLANLAGFGASPYTHMNNDFSQIAQQRYKSPPIPQSRPASNSNVAGGGIASSLNNTKSGSDQTMNNHEIGFIKRAKEYGLDKNEAKLIYKEAMQQGQQMPNMNHGPNFPKQTVGAGMQVQHQAPVQNQSQQPPQAMPGQPAMPMQQPQMANTPVKPQLQLPMPGQQQNPLQQFDQEQIAQGNTNPMQKQIMDKTLGGLTDKTNPERSQEIQTLMAMLRQAQTQG